LFALVQVVSTDTSPPMSDQDLRETASDWSTSIYKLAEQVGVNIDPLKENYVCELCSVGLHKLAQEVENFC
jgi:hypothetical protein